MSRERGQAHTLEGVVAAIVLLAALVFALQATTVTPLSASTSNEYIGTQLRGVAAGTLATGAETGSLKRMVLKWNDTSSGFVGASEDGYYVRPPTEPPAQSDFIDSLQAAYAGQGVAFNIYVQYEQPGPPRQVKRTRLLYQGAPTDNAVSVSRTVTLYDGDIFNRAPRANFTYTPRNPVDGDRVLFNASGTSDFDGTIKTYNWTFTNQNGQTYNKTNVTKETLNFSKLSPGKNVVSLTVTDDNGDTDIIERTVVENAGGPVGNQRPRANFEYTPSDPEDGQNVTFDASGSSDPDGNITEYAWNFTTPAGVTFNTTGETVNTVNLSAGKYIMSLRVTDNSGDPENTDRIERTVIVETPRNSEGYPSGDYFVPNVSAEQPPDTPDTPLYTVVKVEVVVWRL